MHNTCHSIDKCFNYYSEINNFLILVSRVSVTHQDFISVCNSHSIHLCALCSSSAHSSAVIRSHFLCSEGVVNLSMMWRSVIDGRQGAVLSNHAR